MAVTALLGLPMGLGRWLGTPVDEQRVGSPRSALHADRRTLIFVASATGAAPLALAPAADLAREVTGVEDSSTIAAATVLTVMIVVMFGSGSLWLRYRLAHAWLAARRRLPWRLMRFLEDAHRRDVLRQAGASFQFRHERLQRHLSPGGVARSNRPVRARTRLRRVGHTILAGMVLVGVAATVTVPGLRLIIDQRIAEQASLGLLAEADKLQHLDPDTALRLRIAATTLDNVSGLSVPIAAFAQLHEGMAKSWTSLPHTCSCSVSAEENSLAVVDVGSGSAVVIGDATTEPVTFRASPETVYVKADDQARRAVAIDRDGTATFWDLTSTPPEMVATEHGVWIDSQVTFSTSGRWAFVDLADAGVIRLWDLDSVPPQPKELVDARSPVSTRVTEDGQHMIAVADGDATIVDLTTGVAHRVDMPKQIASEFDVLPVGDVAVVRSVAGEVSLTDLATGQVTGVETSANRIAAAGARVLIEHADATASVWDTAGKPARISLGEFATYRSERHAELSPDGRWLVLAGYERLGVLLDLSATPPRPTTVESTPDYLAPPGFTGDGHLVTVTGPETLSLWNLTGGTPREIRLQRHPHETFYGSSEVRFALDGRTVAVQMRGSTRVWAVDTATPRLVASLDPGAVAFTRDGSELLGVHNNVAVSWDVAALRDAERQLQPGDPHSFACQVAGRGLTEQEWARFVPDLPYRPTCG